VMRRCMQKALCLPQCATVSGLAQLTRPTSNMIAGKGTVQAVAAGLLLLPGHQLSMCKHETSQEVGTTAPTFQGLHQ
jgi:hypothetical protein